MAEKTGPVKYLYRITAVGPSHRARVGGKKVKYSADAKKGTNLIELTKEQADHPDWVRFGLKRVDGDAPEPKEPEKTEDPKPSGKKSEIKPSTPKATTKPQSEEFVLPAGWVDHATARKAAYARRITGQDHTKTPEEELNKLLTEYGNQHA